MKKSENTENLLSVIIDELKEKRQDTKFTFGERCAIRECIEIIENHLKDYDGQNNFN